MALDRVSANPATNKFAVAYTTAMRSIPLLARRFAANIDLQSIDLWDI